MSDRFRFDGKRVVVSGAASGMGEATARLLGTLGAEIHALDVKDVSVPVASSARCDLADPEAIDAAVDRIGGPVDALFSCAGLPGPPFSPAEVMAVNFLGPRRLVERALPLMAPGSAIGLISSAGGIAWPYARTQIEELLGEPDFEAARAWCERNLTEGYVFSKMTLIVYVMRESLRLAGRGIRINSICPGPTLTPMTKQFEAAYGKESVDALPKPLGRVSAPEEQAHPLVFLCSDAASYITGINLFVDGGFYAGATLGGLTFTGKTADPR